MGKRLTPLAKFIKEERARQGLSLRDLAKLTGISNPHLSSLERGLVKDPPYGILRKLAEGFKIPFSKLMVIAGYITIEEIREFLEWAVKGNHPGPK